jgi:hypothetical protein
MGKEITRKITSAFLTLNKDKEKPELNIIEFYRIVLKTMAKTDK